MFVCVSLLLVFRAEVNTYTHKSFRAGRARGQPRRYTQFHARASEFTKREREGEREREGRRERGREMEERWKRDGRERERER